MRGRKCLAEEGGITEVIAGAATGGVTEVIAGAATVDDADFVGFLFLVISDFVGFLFLAISDFLAAAAARASDFLAAAAARACVIPEQEGPAAAVEVVVAQ